MTDDAEGYEEKNPLGPGKPVKKGFQDPSGTYPRRDRVGADTPQAALGNDIEVRPGPNRPSARGGSTGERLGLVGRSPSKAKPTYPHNRAMTTASGHLIEYDDTPGFERIRLRHRNGSQLELHANGDIEQLAAGSAYSIVSRDQEVLIRGTCTVVIESNAHLRVQGDLTYDVQGDFNHVVSGNYNLEVLGSHTQRVHGNCERSTTGGLLEATRGDVIRRNLSNYRERTFGDHTGEVGGTYRMSAEVSFRLSSWGHLNASFHGGLMTLTGPDQDGQAGAGELVAQGLYTGILKGQDVYATELHGSQLFAGELNVDGSVYADAVHAPTLEGTATRASWATTAGSAPSGPSTPTSPSPVGPTGPSAAPPTPALLEEVVDVSGTSEDLILVLDRRPLNGRVSRVLSYSEARQRLRNQTQLADPAWLSELVATGAISDRLVGSRVPPTQRRAASVPLSRTDLAIRSIPEYLQLNGGLDRATKLSPLVRLSAVLGDSPLREQVGLTPLDIARNAQLLAFNVIEPLLGRFGLTFSIVEGLYEVWPDEQVAEGLAAAQAQGLCVGISFFGQTGNLAFDAATWAQRNLVYDQLALSYTNYEPDGLDTPVLLIAVVPTGNRGLCWTEFNHVKVADELRDLTDDS